MTRSLFFVGVGLAVALLACTALAAGGTETNTGHLRTYPGETPIFFDDFNEFDLSVWEHELTLGGGGNFEFQAYMNNRTNSFVKDSVLHFKPTLMADKIGEKNVQGGFTLDVWGSTPANLCTGNQFWGCSRTSGAGGNILNPIQSARLRTAHSFNMKYGRIEIRAQLPRGDWLWPAIWMLPRWQYYGEWPSSGEIDIMEARGNPVTYPGDGIDCAGSTMHWGPDWTQNFFKLTHGATRLPKGGKTFADEFHVFGLYWDEAGLYTYVDDDSNRLLEVSFKGESFWDRGQWPKNAYNNPWEGRPNGAPFDQEFYLVMNLAVGGVSNFFPDGLDGKPWSNTDSHSVNAFYAAKDKWLPTWCTKEHPESCHMKVDWVKAWKSDSVPSSTASGTHVGYMGHPASSSSASSSSSSSSTSAASSSSSSSSSSSPAPQRTHERRDTHETKDSSPPRKH